MKPFEFDPNAESIEQERQVIAWFRDYPPKNPKKLLERILQIYHLVPPFIQRSFCNTLLSPKVTNKMEVLGQFIHEIANMPKLIAQLKAEGNHGMVIYKGKSYGISLIANPRWLSKKDIHEWTEEQEDEICNDAIDAWMIENRVRHFTEKVVFFSEYGFSGVSRLMDVRMDDESWEEIKRLKMNDELSKYLNLESDDDN
jgi:hypothetical protein